MASKIGADSIVFNSAYPTGQYTVAVSGQCVLYSQNVVGRDYLAFDNVNAPEQLLQPALFTLAQQMITTASAGNTSFIGNSGIITGTLTHPAANELRGYMMNFASSAAGTGLAAGIQGSNSLFVGSVVGYNGFFFNADVYFPDLSTYSGTTINNQSSGVRIFIGLTDQTLNPAMVSTENFAGNRIGFSYLTSGVPNPNWFISAKNNVTETRTSCGQVFYSGCNYECWLGVAPFPLNNQIFWRLDLLRWHPRYLITQ